MEGEQFLVGRLARLEQLYAALQATRFKLPQEGRVAVRAKRMPVGKAVAGQPLTDDNCNRLLLRDDRAIPRPPKGC